MFRISKEIQFDAGHRVPDHSSKCKNPHGHRYRVVAHLESEALMEDGSETGMVKDFGFLKRLLTTHVHDYLDHGFIVYKGDLPMLTMFDHQWGDKQYSIMWKIIEFPYVPTAENIARWVYERLDHYIGNQPNFELVKVEVWETPTSMAEYTP